MMEVAGSGMNPTLSEPPGPGRTGVPPSTFEMIPDADVGMNQGSIFAAGRRAPTMLKMRVNRKNVKTVAATVLLNVAETRYAIPTTADMYESAQRYQQPTSHVRDFVTISAAIAAAP